jgi:thiol-disulfide isomerase/thioredoxin
MLLTFLPKTAVITALTLSLCGLCAAQTVTKAGNNTKSKVKAASLPKVKQIDIEGLKKLLKPSGKPLLINFWATWCDPCREEFPDLVKISTEFQGKVDFVTVSLDDLADLNTYVPKFLKEMNSEIPAYLLHTPNEAEELAKFFKDWKGNLPLTVLFDTGGALSYERNGRIRLEVLRENIQKLLPVEKAK